MLVTVYHPDELMVPSASCGSGGAMIISYRRVVSGVVFANKMEQKRLGVLK